MGCVLAARHHLFYIGFDKDFLGRLFLRWPAWSIVGHVVLPASLTDVPPPHWLLGGGGPQELIAMAEGTEGLVLGKSGTTCASPWGAWVKPAAQSPGSRPVPATLRP